jgi:putative hydrolase of the HAD superfamily
MEKCILWDFDGTLAFRGGMWSGALLEAVSRFEPSVVCELSTFRPHMKSGFPWHTPDQGHEHLATPDAWWESVIPIFERAFQGVGLSRSRAFVLAREVRSIYLDPNSWTVFDDVVPTLVALRTAGWSHAILSNHVPELSVLIEALGLRQYFDAVFSSATIGFEKPHELAFRRTLDELGNPRTVWMVGDSYNADVVGARCAGLPAVLVRSKHDDAQFQASSLFQLADVIAA